MTRDAEQRTSLDEAIDDAGRAMMRGPTPDLRSRVAERLDARAPVIAWWQPALAAILLVIGALWWWPAREAALPVARVEQPARTEPPRVETAVDRAPAVQEPPPGRRVSPASRTTSRAESAWPEAPRTLPPLDMNPIGIDALQIESTPIDMVDVQALVVESLDVAPLRRSNP